MEDDLVQFDMTDGDELRAEVDEEGLIAGKKKGDDEDGIIAVLQG